MRTIGSANLSTRLKGDQESVLGEIECSGGGDLKDGDQEMRQNWSRIFLKITIRRAVTVSTELDHLASARSDGLRSIRMGPA